MCGICGIINLDNNPVREHPIKMMMGKMKHRGPDDEGVYIKDNIGLGFVRLSIIDLSFAGHQPMISNDGRYVIVFNGEIFNYIEIRERLRGTYSFRSNTDTEVLLAAYISWGESCLDLLNGMFAFIILDTFTMNVFGARDRFGIKPFYYMLNEKQFIFASDIPPILAVLNDKPIPNKSIIYDFLKFNRTNHTYQTFFSNIRKLQHGQKFKIVKNILEENKWYDLEEKVSEKMQNGYSSSNFYSDFSRSIDLQLRSDVPVGTCLSGGIDSSAITSIVKTKESGQELHTFSAIYGNGIEGDENTFISLYDDKGLKMHSTIPTAETLISDLDRFNEALTEPLPNTSEYAEFKVMELAKQYCTVILNGQGADEILAGYHYCYGYFFRDLLKGFKIGTFSYELYKYLSRHKSTLGIKSLVFSAAPNLFKSRKDVWLNKDFSNFFGTNENPLLSDFYAAESLRQFLIRHFEYKFEHHLLWADKSGMYFSLETRFPFLDHNLVENTLASGITIKNGMTKYLLREAMNGSMPDQIVKRKDKTGFLTPEQDWFRNKFFKEFFLDTLSMESIISKEFLDKAIYKKSLNDYSKSGIYCKEFWKWLSLELWMRKYIQYA